MLSAVGLFARRRNRMLCLGHERSVEKAHAEVLDWSQTEFQTGDIVIYGEEVETTEFQ